MEENKIITSDELADIIGLKKNFNCKQVKLSSMVGQSFYAIDFEVGIKTKYGNDKTLVFCKYNLNDDDKDGFKFFTKSEYIVALLKGAKEKGLLPFKCNCRVDNSNKNKFII